MPDLDCFNASGDVSTQNRKDTRWPKRRTIMSCDSSKGPLFTRYYLLETKWGSIYVHCFHTSDDDRALHDHPWSFVSILLSSGYYEWTPAPLTCPVDGYEQPSVRTWVPRFSVIYRPATWRHRVELKNKNTWTLVFRSGYRREWGFWVLGRWMLWKDYGKEWCD